MRHLDGNDFKEKNGYEVNGAWYPRVTKILEVKSKPALEGFFLEMGSIEAANAVKEKSAIEGSMVHETVQKLMCGESIAVPEEIRPAVNAFFDFNEKRNILFHPEFIEKQIWSGRHRYAGTVDALAEIDGKFGVLDIKTSTGFYPEYNLQTAAYVEALKEYEVQRAINLPRQIETRWILRINQHRVCQTCKATLREKGGRSKIRAKKNGGCGEGNHAWGEMMGDIDLKEFPYFYYDTKAFLAAKTLWEWENNYWLRQIGYSK